MYILHALNIIETNELLLEAVHKKSINVGKTLLDHASKKNDRVVIGYLNVISIIHLLHTFSKYQSYV